MTYAKRITALEVSYANDPVLALAAAEEEASAQLTRLVESLDGLECSECSDPDAEADRIILWLIAYIQESGRLADVLAAFLYRVPFDLRPRVVAALLSKAWFPDDQDAELVQANLLSPKPAPRPDGRPM